MGFKGLIKKVIIKLLSKNPRLILFESYADFSDGPLAFYHYLQKNPDYDLVWLISKQNIKKARAMGANYRLIDSKNPFSRLRTFICVHQAKVYCYSHRFLLPSDTHDVLKILFRHGQPFKDVTSYMSSVLQDSYVVSSNDFTAKILGEKYHIPEKRIIRLTNPRVLPLVNGVPEETESLIRARLGISEDKKIITCLCSWHVDGRSAKNELDFLPVSFDRRQLAELNRDLEKKGYCLVIKLHPMLRSEGVPSLSNILFFTNNQMLGRGVDLYELLAIADGLITDYSSVFIDFYLKEKPIYFFKQAFLNEKASIKQPNKNCGFLFEDPEKYMAGLFIETFDDLFKIDLNRDEVVLRESLHNQNVLWNYPIDSNPGNKILSFIKEKLNS